ncbi:MAG: hypothetical protein R3300_07880 [Candidatus Promineifilaceae bacterium]|nr:hypothetical protein [Candidatus Promineifilaceae bacterium]
MLEIVVGKRFLGLAVLAALLLAGSLASQSAAETTHSVTLLYFRGSPQDDGIMLEWATASETETAGFRVERSQTPGGPYTEVDSIGFVTAAGDTLIGASYAELDNEALADGITYYYVLIEVELSGAENVEGPLSVTRPTQDEEATPTSEPNVSPTPQTTLTPSPTSGTPAPTATTMRADSQRSATQTVAETFGRGPGPSPESRIAQVETPSQVVPTATPDPAYPAPAVGGDDSAQPLDESVYPAPATSDPSSSIQIVPTRQFGTELENIEPEPQAEVDSQPFSAIGESEEMQRGSAAQESSGRSVRTTFLLWSGFFAALLVFIAGVFGSIILYARKRDRGP